MLFIALALLLCCVIYNTCLSVKKKKKILLDLLPVSVREKFLKAKDLQAVGQASWEGDGTVAMMLFQQASSKPQAGIILTITKHPVP